MALKNMWENSVKVKTGIAGQHKEQIFLRWIFLINDESMLISKSHIHTVC